MEKEYLLLFPGYCEKYSDKKQVKGERVYLAHTYKLQPTIFRKSRHQELIAASPIAGTVKNREK